MAAAAGGTKGGGKERDAAREGGEASTSRPSAASLLSVSLSLALSSCLDI